MEAMFWLGLLVVLLVIEIITLGLTTIWFAGGALVAFVASALGANMIVQIVLFLGVSFIMLYFTRPVAVKYLKDVYKRQSEKLSWSGFDCNRWDDIVRKR